MALPDIGRAVNIQEDQLQWLISAYSLSSVSLTSTCPWPHSDPTLGMPASVFRASCGPLRAQKGFHDWHDLANGFCDWYRIYEQ